MQTTVEMAMKAAVQLHAAGRLAEAEGIYKQVLAHFPNQSDALHLLGVIAAQTGQPDTAIELIHRAIAIEPAAAEYHNNLSNPLCEKGLYDEAANACREAIRLKPDYSGAYNNLGIALREKGELDQAAAALGEAKRLKPDNAETDNNLGNVLRDRGEIYSAIACYRRSIQINPANSNAHSNLIYASLHHADFDLARILDECRHWADQFERPLAAAILPHSNDRSVRRLRIGYVSSHFRDHPVARFLLPLLRHLHPEIVDVFCYSCTRNPDEITRQFMDLPVTWVNAASMNDEQLAAKIRADQIDILVDLNLHAPDGHLLAFAAKPAPVQVTWLGYAGTTGLKSIDYRLTDPHLDPPGPGDMHYSEKSIRLPHCFWCYEPPLPHIEVSTSPAATNGFVTFGCFNQFAKASPPALDLWASLLSAVPASRLILHAPAGQTRQRVIERFNRAGVPANRIEFVSRQPTRDYFSSYHRIDIALDPFPYGGGTTTCDALWMGVPVVSLRGLTAVGRGGASILSNIGIPQWIAETPAQYLSIARNLAGDLPALAEWRPKLRWMMSQSPLMNAPRFAADMEAAFHEMWDGSR